MTRHATLLLLVLAATASCDAITPGGYASGVPDTTVGNPNMPMGTLSTTGRVDLFREQGWTQAPSGRVTAR